MARHALRESERKEQADAEKWALQRAREARERRAHSRAVDHAIDRLATRELQQDGASTLGSLFRQAQSMLPTQLRELWEEPRQDFDNSDEENQDT